MKSRYHKVIPGHAFQFRQPTAVDSA